MPRVIRVKAVGRFTVVFEEQEDKHGRTGGYIVHRHAARGLADKLRAEGHTVEWLLDERLLGAPEREQGG